MFESDLVHRDLKLANILLHFPANNDGLVKFKDFEISEMELISMDSKAKMSLLRRINLTEVDFKIKIADFGFSKFLDSKQERSETMCGTPLYMAP